MISVSNLEKTYGDRTLFERPGEVPVAFVVAAQLTEPIHDLLAFWDAFASFGEKRKRTVPSGPTSTWKTRPS